MLELRPVLATNTERRVCMAVCVVTHFICNRGCPQSRETVVVCLRQKSETELAGIWTSSALHFSMEFGK
jgi:hypothetical protein